jgi:hypothetical protein
MQVPLANLSAGTVGVVCAIDLGKPEKSFFDQTGLKMGCRLKILACQQGGTYLIQCGDKIPISLSAGLSKNISVKIVDEMI